MEGDAFQEEYLLLWGLAVLQHLNFECMGYISISQQEPASAQRSLSPHHILSGCERRGGKEEQPSQSQVMVIRVHCCKFFVKDGNYLSIY